MVAFAPVLAAVHANPTAVTIGGHLASHVARRRFPVVRGGIGLLGTCCCLVVVLVAVLIVLLVRRSQRRPPAGPPA
jgi:hypothetical protein